METLNAWIQGVFWMGCNTLLTGGQYLVCTVNMDTALQWTLERKGW
jgi:hypothetical protein